MKRFTIVIITLIFVVALSYGVYGGHSEMIVPWEKIAAGEKTMMPMPAAGDVRQHIIGQEPYRTWSKWPGKGTMYQGTEPHGALLTTYVNDIALKSINESKGMRNNSLIIKENHAPNKKLVAITAMYKVKGYNPEGGDWYWVKYDADFNVLSEGKVKGCLDCHSTAKDNDYIFTGDVK